MRQAITKNFLLIVLALAVIFAFAMRATVFQKPSVTAPAQATQPTTDFTAYWFAGKAELNSYQLDQAHVGALSRGRAVLVFVTNDFQTDKQIQSATQPGIRSTQQTNTISVLQATMSRTFATGLSDYSLLTSVFTPIGNPAFPYTLKVSASSQSWLGNRYVQLNYRNNGYQIDSKSNGEPAVDEEYTVEKAMLEDELWSRIRLDPTRLPTGDIRLIPGTMSAQLRSKRLDPLAAKAQIADYAGVLYPGKFLKSYTIQYPTDDRTLMIVFESRFPHKIVGWEETYRSKDNLLTSRAVLQKTIQTDYWNHNAPADSTLRKTLLPNG